MSKHSSISMQNCFLGDYFFCLKSSFSSWNGSQFPAALPAFLHQKQEDDLKTKLEEEANQTISIPLQIEWQNWLTRHKAFPTCFCSVEFSHLESLKADAGEQHIHNSAISECCALTTHACSLSWKWIEWEMPDVTYFPCSEKATHLLIFRALHFHLVIPSPFIYNVI